MPRSPSSNRDIRDVRRDAILRAATKLFARRGFATTKIGDIADGAGVSHGLVYHYFASKEAIFEEILAQRRKRAWDRIAEEEARTGTGAALRDLLRISIDDVVEAPEVTLLVTQALASDEVPERVRASVRRGAREAFERAVALIERGQTRGEVDASVPAEQLASAVFCLLRGVVLTAVQHQRGGASIPVPTVDTVFRLLEPRADAVRPTAAAIARATKPRRNGPRTSLRTSRADARPKASKT
jgi:AcrR family transcriptional regulator